jgi:hypothetical protein
MAMDIVVQIKNKQNSNRAKDVGVLSVLAKVNLLKKIDLSRPNCINGLKHSHGTENLLDNRQAFFCGAK